MDIAPHGQGAGVGNDKDEQAEFAGGFCRLNLSEITSPWPLGMWIMVENSVRREIIGVCGPSMQDTNGHPAAIWGQRRCSLLIHPNPLSSALDPQGSKRLGEHLYRPPLSKKLLPRLPAIGQFLGNRISHAVALRCGRCIPWQRESGISGPRGFVPIVLHLTTINYSLQGTAVVGDRSPRVSPSRDQRISRRSIRSSAGTGGPEGRR